MVFAGLSPRSARRGDEAGVTQGCLREDPHVGGEGGRGEEREGLAAQRRSRVSGDLPAPALAARFHSFAELLAS